MSKRVEATLECGRCRHSFPVALYRTLWIEHPENRNLIFTDKLNVFGCSQCGFENRVEFSMMATNAPLHFAVWYEPYNDPQIDADRQGYIDVFGEGNYFAEAPRVREWQAFKDTIIEFETGRRVGQVPLKHDAYKPPSVEKKGTFAKLFKRKAD